MPEITRLAVPEDASSCPPLNSPLLRRPTDVQALCTSMLKGPGVRSYSQRP